MSPPTTVPKTDPEIQAELARLRELAGYQVATYFLQRKSIVRFGLVTLAASWAYVWRPGVAVPS